MFEKRNHPSCIGIRRDHKNARNMMRASTLVILSLRQARNTKKRCNFHDFFQKKKSTTSNHVVELLLPSWNAYGTLKMYI